MNKQELAKRLAQWFKQADINEFGTGSPEVEGSKKYYKPLATVLADVALAQGVCRNTITSLYHPERPVYSAYWNEEEAELDMLFGEACKYILS